MEISGLESLIRAHPIIFASAATFVAYNAFFLGWGLLEKIKRKRIEKELDVYKKIFSNYVKFIDEHSDLQQDPEEVKKYKKCKEGLAILQE